MCWQEVYDTPGYETPATKGARYHSFKQNKRCHLPREGSRPIHLQSLRRAVDTAGGPGHRLARCRFFPQEPDASLVGRDHIGVAAAGGARLAVFARIAKAEGIPHLGIPLHFSDPARGPVLGGAGAAADRRTTGCAHGVFLYPVCDFCIQPVPEHAHAVGERCADGATQFVDAHRSPIRPGAAIVAGCIHGSGIHTAMPACCRASACRFR